MRILNREFRKNRSLLRSYGQTRSTIFYRQVAATELAEVRNAQ
jgi:hypothetical protein